MHRKLAMRTNSFPLVDVSRHHYFVVFSFSGGCGLRGPSEGVWAGWTLGHNRVSWSSVLL